MNDSYDPNVTADIPASSEPADSLDAGLVLPLGRVGSPSRPESRDGAEAARVPQGRVSAH
jgi:hypothetical protein